MPLQQRELLRGDRFFHVQCIEYLGLFGADGAASTGPEQIKLLLEGIAFRDGEPVQDNQPVQQKLAA